MSPYFGTASKKMVNLARWFLKIVCKKRKGQGAKKGRNFFRKTGSLVFKETALFPKGRILFKKLEFEILIIAML